MATNDKKVVSTYTLTCNKGDYSEVIINDHNKALMQRDLHEMNHDGHRVSIDVATNGQIFSAIDKIIANTAININVKAEARLIDLSNEKKSIEYTVLLPEGDKFAFTLHHSSNENPNESNISITVKELNFISGTSGESFLSKTFQISEVLKTIENLSEQLDLAFQTEK